MPGEYDPANHFMPQQPLHKCMFPKALSYPTVKSVSNPYEASIGGIRYVHFYGYVDFDLDFNRSIFVYNINIMIILFI